MISYRNQIEFEVCESHRHYGAATNKTIYKIIEDIEHNDEMQKSNSLFEYYDVNETYGELESIIEKIWEVVDCYYAPLKYHKPSPSEYKELALNAYLMWIRDLINEDLDADDPDPLYTTGDCY